MKFGKKIQAEQIPGWSEYYLDYKGLKKIVGSLRNTAASSATAPPPSRQLAPSKPSKGALRPSDLFSARSGTPRGQPPLWDAGVPPSAPTPLPTTPAFAASSTGDEDRGQEFQMIKAAFFFKLQRELDKINTFYLQKEAELKLRLATLVSKQRSAATRMQPDLEDETTATKDLVEWRAVEEGFRLLQNDLLKLQQFVEINAVGFRKILKKWDKRSKSTTRELYLARQVEVQPVFNRQLITEFADTVAACLVNITNMGTGASLLKESNDPDPLLSERIVRDRTSQSRAFVDLESDLRKAVAARDANAIQLALIQGSELAKLPDGRTYVTRISWKAAIDAPPDLADLIMTSPNSVCDFHFVDDINGRTCLHEAAAAGALRMVNLCLDHNAEVNRKDVYGRTTLHYSSMGGYVNICTRLLEAGADPSPVDMDNFNPLYYAVVNGHLECLRVLLEVGKVGLEPTVSDANPLALACRSGHLDVTILLLQYGAKNLPNTNGEYPLHLAAKEGHVEVCKLLCVETRETLDTPDKYNEWTPLFHAANNGHEGCVRVLLQAGCNPMTSDEFSRLAIYYAAWFGHIACTFLLYDAISTFPRRQISLPQAGAPTPSANRMSPFDLGPDAVDHDAIPSLSLPPPIMPFRIYGHNYLEKSYLVQLALGQPFSAYTTKPSQLPIEITPWTTDPDLRRPHLHAPPSLKLVMSSRSGKSSVPFTLTIPLSDHQDTLSFQIQNLDELSLEFSFYPNFGSKTIGRAAILPSVFQGIQDTKVIHLPVLDHRLHIIGRLTIDVCIISPFQDVALQVGGTVETYWKSSAQYSGLGGLGPTSNVPRLVASSPSHRSAIANGPGSVTISSLSGDYLHVVVQVTRDLVPVVYSKWHLPVNGVDVAVCNVSAAQFSSIAVGKGLVLNSMRTPGTVQEWAATLQTSMLILEHLLKLLPMEIGVMLHVAYPGWDLVDELCMGRCADVNTYVEAILKTVYQASASLGSTPHSRRRFAFMALSPSVCTALNWKQPNYAVFFATHGGVDPQTGHDDPSSTVRSTDRRCLSVANAVEFAKSNNLLGILVNARLLRKVPSIVWSIKDAGLVVGSFGQEADAVVLANPSSDPHEAVDAILSPHGVVHFVDQASFVI